MRLRASLTQHPCDTRARSRARRYGLDREACPAAFHNRFRQWLIPYDARSDNPGTA